MNNSDSKENLKKSIKGNSTDSNGKKKKAGDIIKNKEELGKIQDFVKKNKKQRHINERLKQMDTVHETENEHNSEEENLKAEEITEIFFKKAAKSMFQKKKTIALLMEGRVFDIMQAGREVAVVYSKDFFKRLEEFGLELSKEI